MKALLFALAIFNLPLPAMADEIPSETEKMGSQKFRVLVQIHPEDIRCVDTHVGDFGQPIPGMISFEPMKGDSGFWWNKIADYDQRANRVVAFVKFLKPEEKCEHFLPFIPRNNRYVNVEREVVGKSLRVFQQRIGILEERVRLIFSDQLTLNGSFEWKDLADSNRKFRPEEKIWRFDDQ